MVCVKFGGIWLLLNLAASGIYGDTFTCDTEEDEVWSLCVFENVTIPTEGHANDIQLMSDNFNHTVLEFHDSSMAVIPAKIFEVFPLLKRLDVDFCDIQNVSRSTFRNAMQMEKLFVTGNRIEVLPDYVFSDMKNLYFLYLSQNRLNELAPKSLSGLTRLHTLSFEKNSLTHIDQNVFEDCTSLVYLDLSDNFITVFGMDHTAPLLKLESLNLSNNSLDSIFIPRQVKQIFAKNNKISSLDFEEKGVGKLNTLIITGNRLRNFDNITKFINLSNLALSFYDVEIFDLDMFLKMEKLKVLNLKNILTRHLQFTNYKQHNSLNYLDLSDSNLTYIDFDVLKAFPSIMYLIISGNQLSFIDYENIQQLLPALKAVDIRKNPWNCNILAEITSYFEKNSINWIKEGDLCPLGRRVGEICCSDIRMLTKQELVVLHKNKENE